MDGSNWHRVTKVTAMNNLRYTYFVMLTQMKKKNNKNIHSKS